jgi:hypothetical protein
VLPQKLELKLGLDPLGDHCLAQPLGERDHRQHHRFVLRVVADSLDEGLVGLHRVTGFR